MMKKHLFTGKNLESGQYLVIFALVLIGLFGFAALAIDGGRIYVEKRRVQNSVDNTAIAVAFAYCRNLQNPNVEGFSIANANGYNNNGTSNWVTINTGSGLTEVIIKSTIPTTLAKVVGINSLSVTSRAVGACEGGGVSQALFAASDNCGSGGKTIDWSGSNITVNGDIHSNDNFYVSGSSNILNGTATIRKPGRPPSSYDSSKITFNPASPNPVPGLLTATPISINYLDYAPGGSEAIAAGSKYYSCNTSGCKIDMGWMESRGLYNSNTHVIKDGLYYAKGLIDLGASDLIGNHVTFVSGGTIDVSGSNQFLRPYTKGLLTYSYYNPTSDKCNKQGIKIGGSSNDWGGIIYAPNSLVEISGSSNSTVDGAVIGWALRLNGSDLLITYNGDFFPASISLVE